MVAEDKRTFQAYAKSNVTDRIIGTQPNYIDACTYTITYNTSHYTGLQADCLDANLPSVFMTWRRIA